MSIKENIKKFQYKINTAQARSPYSHPITFLVATKYATAEQIKEVLEAGITVIGENKVQDAAFKQQQLGKTSADWHFIGTLQTNKINKALDTFSYFQSLDRLSLLEKLNEKAKAQNKTLRGLVQLNSGEEENKSGFSAEELLTNHAQIFSFANIKIEGIMVVTPVESEPSKTRENFKKARHVFDSLKAIYPHLMVLSMGMSQDFELAIEEGATCVRIGRAVFQ